MKTRELDEAGRIVDSLAKRPFSRLRSYLGIEHLPRHLLSGAALAEIGEYERAVRAFGRVTELCENQLIRFQYSLDLCRKLQAQMHFRSGEVALRKMKTFSYSEAIEF